MTEFFNFGGLCHMKDQGIVLWTSLCLKDLNNRLLVQPIGAQAVNRFRGNGHQAAPADDVCGGLRRGRIGGASLVPEKFVQIIEAANQPTA